MTNSSGTETMKVIEIALKKASELNIKHIVVASSSGDTALSLREKAPTDITVSCITYHYGFKEPGKNMMSAANKKALEDLNVHILATTHLMAGLDRALRFRFEGIYPSEIIANTLRLFGQGVKVAVEVATMALDAGLIPYGDEIISLGGHGKGADSALVLTPAHSNYFFDTKIKEIICRPRDF